MPRDDHWSDSDSDQWDDESDDYGPDDESTTTECIKCGCDIYDDAARCPLCGEYQVGERTHTIWKGRPLWWIMLALIGICSVICALLFALLAVVL